MVSKIGKLAAELALIILVGYLLLVGVYALPVGRIQAHVGSKETFDVMDAERNYPKLIAGHDDSRLDNFTDAIMLKMACSYSEFNPFKKALLNPHQTSNGGEASAEDVMCLYLGEAPYHTYYYSRYWHGYLIWLKPLLMFLSYDEIRYVLMTVDLGVLALVFYLIGKRNKKELFLPVALAALSFNIPAVCLSMQYNSIYLLTMISLAVILLFEDYFEDDTTWPYFFLLSGALTSYFDFFTCPPIVFAIPMAMLMIIYEDGIKSKIGWFVINGIVWCIGFLFMWGSKWILAQLFTGEKVITNAIEEIIFRTSDEGFEGSISMRSILEAVWRTQNYYIIAAIAVCIIGLFVGLIMRRQIDFSKLIALLCIAVIPFAWYFLTKNHSGLHTYMTYREIAILIFALSGIGLCCYERD